MAEATRVVVLGGTGFLGRHVCASFVDAGYDVLAVARGPAPGSGQDPPAELLPLDLLAMPPAGLTAMLVAARAGVVVNAVGAVWDLAEDVLQRLNVVHARRIVDAVAAVPWRVRLIHLGSAHEYGPGKPGVPIDEHWVPRPTSRYGQTKLEGSRLVITAARAGRLDAVVLRVAGAIGPGMPGESLLGRVSRELAGAAGTSRPAVLRLTPLTAWRDFIDVGDVADAVRAAAGTPVGGQVINVGSGRLVHVRDLVDLLIAVSGTTARLVSARDTTASRGAGIEYQRLDIDAARRLLGWAPRRELADSVRALWAATVATRL